MCTEYGGAGIRDTFFKYHSERPIDERDKEILDGLVSSAFIVYSYKDGVAYAKPNPVMSGLKNQKAVRKSLLARWFS